MKKILQIVTILMLTALTMSASADPIQFSMCPDNVNVCGTFDGPNGKITAQVMTHTGFGFFEHLKQLAQNNWTENLRLIYPFGGRVLVDPVRN